MLYCYNTNMIKYLYIILRDKEAIIYNAKCDTVLYYNIWRSLTANLTYRNPEKSSHNKKSGPKLYFYHVLPTINMPTFEQIFGFLKKNLSFLKETHQ